MKVTYKISDIFDLQMGKTPSRDEHSFWNSNDYKWVAISDLDNCKYIENTSEYISSQAVKNTGIKVVPKNTVIMSFKLSIGKVAITKEDMYTNEAIMAFFNKGVVNLELSYLYYLLKSYKWDLLAQRAAKGKSLNKEILNNATLCFHSNIQTQKEIVAVLDKVTSLISMRKEQLEKLDILVKSKFIEMFGDPVLNPKGWEKKKLGEVCNLINGKKEKNLNLPLLNVKYLRTRQEKQMYKEGVRVNKNDYLILVDGENSGEVFKAYEDGILGSTFKILEINSDLSDRYILHILDFNKNTFKKSKKGAAIPHLDKDLFRNTPLSIPPLELQNQFAEFAEQVEKNKENIKSSLNRLEILYNALMQEYFG